MKIAFIFPGQGSQYLGMAKKVHSNFPESKEVSDPASSVLGYDLLQLCLSGPVERLNLTENTQPALSTACIACCIRSRGAGWGLPPRPATASANTPP